VRNGARRAAATLLALALLAPATAHAAIPTDPEFTVGGQLPPWAKAINWEPSDPNVGWPAIAVVDSGMWAGFNDFAGYVDGESADCTHGSARAIGSASDVNDVDAHGTRVATLAAAPANGVGSVGVSPDSPMIVIRFFTKGGPFNAPCAFKYLTAIAGQQPLVVNLSFTMDSTTPGARLWLDRLVRAGALVVAASGNFRSLTPGWPASESHVLAVGRSDGDASKSAGGTKLDLVAPGGGLRLPDLAPNSWHTGTDEGTSFAAPIVAGVAARVWGSYGDVADPQVIAYLMRKTAKRLGGKAFTSRFGFGLVDLGAATHVPASQVPQTDELEPDDRPSQAATAVACRSACRLHGIVVSSDDPIDYFRIRRSRCPRGKLRIVSGKGNVTAACVRPRGRTYIKVRVRKNRQQAYTISVPRR
jgi:hypothetical protein